jgi:Fanconi anemia group M protein
MSEKKLYNIFTKKEIRIIEKKKILADYREKNCLVPSELIKLNFELEYKNLIAGDYVVNGVVIERKSVEDFLSSMTNKRLLNQIENLKQFEKPLIIIEGIEEQDLYGEYKKGINSNSVRGFILSILLRHKIPIAFSKNPLDTATYINLIANKKERNISLNNHKKAKKPQDSIQFILEGFPGIGPTTAKKLLKKYKTLKNIFSSQITELENLIGKKANSFKLLNSEF